MTIDRETLAAQIYMHGHDPEESFDRADHFLAYAKEQRKQPEPPKCEHSWRYKVCLNCGVSFEATKEEPAPKPEPPKVCEHNWTQPIAAAPLNYQCGKCGMWDESVVGFKIEHRQTKHFTPQKCEHQYRAYPGPRGSVKMIFKCADCGEPMPHVGEEPAPKREAQEWWIYTDTNRRPFTVWDRLPEKYDPTEWIHVREVLE